MADTMTIGEFSRATRLSAKALRFYHRIGLLEPAWVDPVNGYRMYSPGQIADAQVVRHFRSLDMPVDVLRDLLTAGPDGRAAAIAAHLDRLEAQLDHTRSAVSSLRALVAPAASPVPIVHRSVAAIPALVVGETIDLAELGSWYTDAMAELDSVTTTMRPAGPAGGIWSTELFVEERGTAMLFRPVTSPPTAPLRVGRVRTEVLPPVELAVATHRGPDATIGQTYGALGEYVARHELGVEGPIREYYLQRAAADGQVVTEIGWPVFRTRS